MSNGVPGIATSVTTVGSHVSGRSGDVVAKWSVHELAFASAAAYGDPLSDVDLSVEFRAPSGKRHSVAAFWDGNSVWRVRFSPDEVGRWSWQSTCSDAGNAGLHDQSGIFQCVRYSGKNPLLAHGPIRVAPDGTHFVHADGTPFFWLGCTAWNGVLRSRDQEWRRYLAVRQQQSFSVIQFVSTPWRGGRATLRQRAYTTVDPVQISPAFFQALDAKVAAINAHGLCAAPVVLWAYGKDDPGRALSRQDAARLAKYIVTRWGAYQVVWLLGGDGDYLGENARRWCDIGRQVFGARRDRLVTLHPMGQRWVAGPYENEDWFDFIGYQSGHGGADSHLRWHVAGPAAAYGCQAGGKPVVNLEPNYEAIPAYESGKKHDDRHVRRAAYWSLLINPPAGVTYGHNAVWVWNHAHGPAEGHKNIGTVAPWHAGLETDGTHGMTVLRRFFESGPWTGLRPDPSLLIEEPGVEDPSRFVAAARTDDGAWAVVYTPVGGRLRIRSDRLTFPARARWFSPRTGTYHDAGALERSRRTFETPDPHDWILDIRGV